MQPVDCYHIVAFGNTMACLFMIRQITSTSGQQQEVTILSPTVSDILLQPTSHQASESIITIGLPNNGSHPEDYRQILTLH